MVQVRSRGVLDFSNKEWKLPQVKEIKPRKSSSKDIYGQRYLKKSTYKEKSNETLNLSKDLIAIALRSSLLRIGGFHVEQSGMQDLGERVSLCL